MLIVFYRFLCTTNSEIYFSSVNIMKNSQSTPPMDPQHFKLSAGNKTSMSYIAIEFSLKLNKFRH